MNPCDDFSSCTIHENDDEGFSCPCIEYEGLINRIGDGRKSGPGNAENFLRAKNKNDNFDLAINNIGFKRLCLSCWIHG